MDESIEADLIAAHRAPFPRDEAGWTDAYITSLSRIDARATPASVAKAAGAAWRSHGWAHPAVVAGFGSALETDQVG